MRWFLNHISNSIIDSNQICFSLVIGTKDDFGWSVGVAKGSLFVGAISTVGEYAVRVTTICCLKRMDLEPQVSPNLFHNREGRFLSACQKLRWPFTVSNEAFLFHNTAAIFSAKKRVLSWHGEHQAGFFVVDVVVSGSFNGLWTIFTSYEDLVKDDFVGRDLCGFL